MLQEKQSTYLFVFPIIYVCRKVVLQEEISYLWVKKVKFDIIGGQDIFV